MVFGKSFSEHLNNLKKVLERFCMANLKLKPKKCCLAGIKDVDLVIRCCSGKKNAGADALSYLPMDQDDNGDSSLSEKQGDNNDIFVAATVIADNAKRGERDSEDNNENESSSSCCQQE